MNHNNQKLSSSKSSIYRLSLRVNNSICCHFFLYQIKFKWKVELIVYHHWIVNHQSQSMIYICTYFQTPPLLILIRYTLKKTQAVTNQIKACSSAFRESFRLKLGDCKSVWVLKHTDIRQIVNYCVVLLIKGFFW